MSTAAHTPGPWSIFPEPCREHSDWTDHGGYRIDAPGIEQLAFIWNSSRRIPLNGPQSEGPEFGAREGEANARLIAAAPDLLGALRFILAFYEPGQTYLDTNAWKNAEAAARDAVAKAEGRA